MRKFILVPFLALGLIACNAEKAIVQMGDNLQEDIIINDNASNNIDNNLPTEENKEPQSPQPDKPEPEVPNEIERVCEEEAVRGDEGSNSVFICKNNAWVLQTVCASNTIVTMEGICEPIVACDDSFLEYVKDSKCMKCIGGNITSITMNRGDTCAGEVVLPYLYNVTLVTYEPSKLIPVIKEVRTYTGLDLGAGKALVESAPSLVKECISEADANFLIEKLELAGGTASKSVNRSCE